MEFECKYTGIDVIATGKKIDRLIKAGGYSIKTVCNMLGVSNQCVYKWIHGQTLPSLENMYQLSRLFGTTIDTLIVGTECVNYVLPENYVRDDWELIGVGNIQLRVG